MAVEATLNIPRSNRSKFMVCNCN